MRQKITPARLRVLHAVSVLWLDGTVTIPKIQGFTGLRSKSTVADHLWSLRALGLVEWEDGKIGTIRPAEIG